MTKYALVDLDAGAVVPQRGQAALSFEDLSRIRLPDADRSTADNPSAGYEFPPESTPKYRLYEVAIVIAGSGPVLASESDPVFDEGADTVTITRTMEDAPVPPTNDEIYDQVMQGQKVLKAFALCINDGSIVPGANVSGTALKTAIKAKM